MKFSIKDLAKIIERDSKDATYKYALLRGTIEIIQAHDNYKIDSAGKIIFPLGLLILRWIEYYYPILSSNTFIPQKHGDSRERTIAFRTEFEQVIGLYPTTKSADQLSHDLKKGIADPAKIQIIGTLAKKIKTTIIRQPMHYIGSAIGRGGEIYQYNNDSRTPRNTAKLNMEGIIDYMGTFSIPIEFYHVMQVIGSFVTGTHSLIFRWAEFTSNLSKDQNIKTSDMISLLNTDFNEREIMQARNFYSNIISANQLKCVWSGKSMQSDWHVDHMIPFIALRNNDLWNLLPAKGNINIRKSDKIPSDDILNEINIKDRIIHYWEQLILKFPEQFRTEIQVSLLGNTQFLEKTWKNESYNRLLLVSKHMIEDRGFEPWISI
ncbi:HNH endonuclease [bacterium]|nr:HNH endonuclease [bacterium]